MIHHERNAIPLVILGGETPKEMILLEVIEVSEEIPLVILGGETPREIILLEVLYLEELVDLHVETSP